MFKPKWWKVFKISLDGFPYPSKFKGTVHPDIVFNLEEYKLYLHFLYVSWWFMIFVSCFFRWECAVQSLFFLLWKIVLIMMIYCTPLQKAWSGFPKTGAVWLKQVSINRFRISTKLDHYEGVTVINFTITSGLQKPASGILKQVMVFQY